MDDAIERCLAALELLAIEGMVWHPPEVLRTSWRPIDEVEAHIME